MKKSPADKKKTDACVPDSTKYYKATYITGTGTREDEVYISESLESAVQYATGPNARDRILERVQEFSELIDALL